MAQEQRWSKIYVVRLDGHERDYLETIIRKGKDSAGRLAKARILLKTDASERGPGWADHQIMDAFDVSLSTVQRLRRRFVERGFDAALNRKRQENPPVARIFDGEKEARLIQLACSEPPAGYARWPAREGAQIMIRPPLRSGRLLESSVVELGIVAAASDSTIGRVLKKRSQTAPV